MAEDARTIAKVLRTPDLIRELGPGSRSGTSAPVRARMTDGNYVDLFFHQEGWPDLSDDQLIGLTESQALALVQSHALTQLR
jgi:hypothetical protein